jgi:hypothetical protein
VRAEAAESSDPVSQPPQWSREGILEPSISASTVKRWSYTDLMGLRTIHWLRHWKRNDEGSDIPASVQRYPVN